MQKKFFKTFYRVYNFYLVKPNCSEICLFFVQKNKERTHTNKNLQETQVRKPTTPLCYAHLCSANCVKERGIPAAVVLMPQPDVQAEQDGVGLPLVYCIHVADCSTSSSARSCFSPRVHRVSSVGVFANSTNTRLASLTLADVHDHVPNVYVGLPPLNTHHLKKRESYNPLQGPLP